MAISKISAKQSFKNLFYTNDLKKILVDERTSPAMQMEFAKIKSIIKNTGADRKKYVDVFLDYDYGFYGIISSKKQGVPYNPDYKCKISSKKSDILNFKNWVNSWNHAYSPKGLSEQEMLQKKALECLLKHKKSKAEIDLLV